MSGGKNKATIIRVDGTEQELDHRPTLKEAQTIVGGWIEQLPSPPGKVVFGDEEGNIKGKPDNQKASEMLGYIVVGDILVLEGWRTLGKDVSMPVREEDVDRIAKAVSRKLDENILPGQHLPTRDQVCVSVWEERDQLHIALYDKKTGKRYGDWWDDEARQMFEDGFFKRGKDLEKSVLEYGEYIGILAK